MDTHSTHTVFALLSAHATISALNGHFWNTYAKANTKLSVRGVIDPVKAT